MGLGRAAWGPGAVETAEGRTEGIGAWTEATVASAAEVRTA